MNMMNKTTTFLVAAVFLSACSSGGGGEGGEAGGTAVTPQQQAQTPSSLNQAVYIGGGTYQYGGGGGIPNLPITGAPADTDFTRSAMLHDGTDYRLYFFKQGTEDTIYQFGYNASTQSYEFGYRSIDVLKITNKPGDADASSFAMLHDGTTYRLYMRGKTNVTTLYQFGFNGSSYAYGHNSIPQLFITGSPADADHSRWAMLHDGTRYRLYTAKTGSTTTLYQHAFNPASSDYEYGFDSINQLDITGMPADSITSQFMMNHGGSKYRFYYPSTK